MAGDCEVLDRAERADRGRVALTWLGGLVLVSLILGRVALVWLPGEANLTRGRLVALHAASSEEGHYRFVTVELDSGKRVQAVFPTALPFRPHATVEIAEISSFPGAGRRYRVVRYPGHGEP